MHGHKTEISNQNQFNYLKTGISYTMVALDTLEDSVFVAPVIIDNKFTNTAKGIVVETPSNNSGMTIPFRSVLHITCNTFDYTYGSVTNNITGYGIKVEPQPHNGSTQMHEVDIKDPNETPQNLITMKNQFWVNDSSAYSDSHFIAIANDVANAYTLNYRTFQYPQSGTMNGTNKDNLIVDGNVFIEQDGAFFEDNVNDCESEPGKNYDHGINHRMANPNSSSTIEDVKPVAKLSNYPNPFARQTTIEYIVPEGKQHAEVIICEPISGKVIKRLKVDVKENRVELTMQEIASGMYIYSLVADDEIIATDKMVLYNTPAYE